MNYKQLIEQISTQSNLAQTTIKHLLDNMQDIVANALAEKEEITFTKLGKFTTTECSARKGRNPKTGEALEIADKTSPVFVPSKILREAVNE